VTESTSVTKSDDHRPWPDTPVNLAEKISAVSAPWTPHIVGALNGQLVKIARLEGAFVWHAHEREDELFLVLRGSLRIEMRPPARDVTLREGEFFIVPRGVEHRPVAEEGCVVMLFEPEATSHAGGADTDRAVPINRQPRV